jgi:hypothetical protein
VLDNRPPLRVVMEACGSAHDWARRFARQQRPSAASLSRVDSRIRCSDPVNRRIVRPHLTRFQGKRLVPAKPFRYLASALSVSDAKSLIVCSRNLRWPMVT